MMSDSVVPVIKPISSLTARKKLATYGTTTSKPQVVTPSIQKILFCLSINNILHFLQVTNKPTIVFAQAPCRDGNCTSNKRNNLLPCPKHNPMCRSKTTTTSSTTMSTIEQPERASEDGNDSGSPGTSHSSPCPLGELRCVDGRCITLNQLCDRHVDCSDGADEINCFT
jgi:hypothetical protein